MGFLDSTNLKSSGKHNIAMIDGFKIKDEDIDGDDVPDISHGNHIKRYIQANNPNINIFEYDVTLSSQRGFSGKKIADSLEDIEKRVEKGEKIDAVNMSLANYNYYTLLSGLIEKNVDSNNVDKYKSEIKGRIASSLNYDPHLTRGINSMERLNSKGIPVYLAGGNYEDQFNLYSLANNAIVVGSTAYKDSEGKGASKNSCIKLYEEGKIDDRPILSVKDNSLIGYDINNDGHVDIDVSELSGKGEYKRTTYYGGSSFAAPQAMLRKFKENK